MDKEFLSVEKDWDLIMDIIENGDVSDISLSGDEDDSIPLIERQAPQIVKRVGADKVGVNDVCRNTISEDEDDGDVMDAEMNLLCNENNPELNNLCDNIMVTPKESIKWKRKPLSTMTETYKAPNFEESVLCSPIQYLKRYIPDDLFTNMAAHTNIYSLQQGKYSFKQTTTQELEVLFGLHIPTGALKFPRLRMYWDTSLKVSVFWENMSRDRFLELRTNLHVVNNLEKPPENKDKFYKVRPVYTAIRKRCSELPIEENVCVVEGIIPFTGKFSAKQYIKGKSSPWGIKVFMLCGKSGIVHDFLLYQGATTELNTPCCKKFGLSPAVVLGFSVPLSKGKGHKLYFDNFFSSYHLFQLLKSQGINAAGTVRQNRFGKNLLFSDDKTIMKQTRGYCEEITSADDITMFKWLDNRPVVLCSNFVGKGSVDEVEFGDKKHHK
ncbi:piggyBac transposable element-derived protein 3-like [Schistocerca piceifrons]|uniref:piggyBac transposable element-derived protein 3-like n=1 Tax=Schistocerca piceifrons TaxID=274613 RepID=UPI001F5EE345|nr:piggyBac transposable element-derived protein 3-like [Schistocerca piceifrons]